MKGLRTVLINGAVVIGTATLTYIAGVDWTEFVNPTVAVIIVGAANFGLRFVTDTAVGRSE